MLMLVVMLMLMLIICVEERMKAKKKDFEKLDVVGRSFVLSFSSAPRALPTTRSRGTAFQRHKSIEINSNFAFLMILIFCKV